jgi:hypothetical protein
MVFEIRNKVFKIELVNNWCRLRYQDLIDKVAELTAIPGEIQGLVKEADSNKDIDDLKRIKAEIKRLSKSTGSVTKEIIDIRLDIVRELLESNLIDFDQNFWLRKADADDVNNLIMDSLTRDTKEKGGSKKK